eukprot:TRINITY_DN5862_c0_g1_i4.p1 TRINITY_DN5862_c0_g1~~TRINITY_DN5862_c0_g1_i4.p1  ORF type:complete len:340 (+),score=137.61 TRINITY_DN5862_c0_g1_i4:103-1122(+)
MAQENNSNWEKRELSGGDGHGKKVPEGEWEAVRHLLGCAMSVGTAVTGDTAGLKKVVEAYLTAREGEVAGCFAGVEAVVLDIEGTTTPIPFVTETLFPYAEKKVEGFVKEKLAEVDDVVQAMRLAAAADQKEFPDVPQIAGRAAGAAKVAADVAANLIWNSQKNRKVTAMKELQGRIWREGYASGDLKGYVYPDVPAAFKRWTGQGVKCYIYSSGSVGAQKLLFGQSSAGNLLPYLSGHFDTTTGGKREAASYAKIAAAIGRQDAPASVLFLTDIVGEATAARAAGMRVALLHRPANHLIDAADQSAAAAFPQLRTFDAILPDEDAAADGRPAKRRRKN